MYPSTIGIFPLPLLMLPGEHTQLHIFEARYKKLVNGCIEQNLVFGIPVMLKDKSITIGSLVSITNVVQRYDSGELDITITCLELFKLERMYESVDKNSYNKALIAVIPQENFNTDDFVFINLLAETNRLSLKPLERARNQYPVLAAVELLNMDTKDKVDVLTDFMTRQELAGLSYKLLYFNKLCVQEKQLNYRFYLN